MRLFHTPASPFVRKVTVVLIETGMAGRVMLRRVATAPTDPIRSAGRGRYGNWP